MEADVAIEAEPAAAKTPGDFDRDTAVRRRGVADVEVDGGSPEDAGADDGGADDRSADDGGADDGGADDGSADDGSAQGGGAEGDTTVLFDAEVSNAWHAGRGPHGGYLAAMLLRALTDTVADPARAPRSLTVHYARAPSPGPVTIAVAIERAGRSLSTLSARMEQEGRLQALALAAFSVPWRAAEVLELPLPEVAPPDPERAPVAQLHPAMPPFLRNVILQPRIGAMPFSGSSEPMEVGAWLGLPGPRPLDAPALALFSDALFSPPFVRLPEPAITPTIDLTIHFRRSLANGLDLAPDAGPREPSDPHPPELCFARFSSTVVHEGFFEEDGVIWAADGTVLAHSRQLAVVVPFDPSAAQRS
jgi:acyl-CoA thioesterase